MLRWEGYRQKTAGQIIWYGSNGDNKTKKWDNNIAEVQNVAQLNSVTPDTLTTYQESEPRYVDLVKINCWYVHICQFWVSYITAGVRVVRRANMKRGFDVLHPIWSSQESQLITYVGGLWTWSKLWPLPCHILHVDDIQLYKWWSSARPKIDHKW